jgi:hypothetical protein
MRPKTTSTVKPPFFEMEVLRDKATLIFSENPEEVNEPDGEDRTPGFHGWKFDRYTLEWRYDPDLRSRVEARLGEWVEMAKQKEREALEAKERSKRDKLLVAADVTRLDDYPISNDCRLAYREYRRLLREVPDQPGFPYDIDWPVEPSKE